MDHGLSYQGN
jgi:hypothetical protein